MKTLIAAACASLIWVTPALAQNAPSPDATQVEDVIVVARRSGAPIWEVTRGGGTVLLVGEIGGVPAETPWSATALEAATERSQRVMSGIGVRGSLSDLFRIIWRARTLTRLPGSTTSADYLTPDWQARLDAIEARTGKDYGRQSFLLTPGDLLKDSAEFGVKTADDAGDVVRRAARRARTPVRPVEAETRGNQMIEDLLTAPPSSRLTCMHAAIEAAEAGPDAVLARGRAWTRRDIPTVLASPIQRALDVCWPWGDPDLGPSLKAAWVNSIEGALGEPGVTMAVAPLSLLAEPGGVLDRLEAQGAEIDGPDWK